jgi:hypothetical protein
MPKAKKKATELTDDEVLKRLFPKPVIQELKRLAAESNVKKPTKSQPRKKG